MFKKGDKVHIKPNANEINRSPLYFNPTMTKYLDGAYTVEYAIKILYKLAGNGVNDWFWDEEWLEPAYVNNIDLTESEIIEILKE